MLTATNADLSSSDATPATCARNVHADAGDHLTEPRADDTPSPVKTFTADIGVQAPVAWSGTAFRHCRNRVRVAVTHRGVCTTTW